MPHAKNIYMMKRTLSFCIIRRWPELITSSFEYAEYTNDVIFISYSTRSKLYKYDSTMLLI